MTEDMLSRLSDRETLIRALTQQELVRHDQALAGLLADYAMLKEYSVTDALITEGKVGHQYLYCILSGKVQVLVEGKVISEGGAGDAFGEFPNLNPETPHAVTLRASTPCVAALVHERDLRTVAKAHPVLWENMAKMFTERLQVTTERLDAVQKQLIDELRRKIQDAPSDVVESIGARLDAVEKQAAEQSASSASPQDRIAETSKTTRTLEDLDQELEPK